MTPEYRAQYERLTREYLDTKWSFDKSNRPPGMPTAKNIHDAILRQIESMRLNRIIRPDAIHFLLINIHQIIYLPILTQNNSFREQLRGKLNIKPNFDFIISNDIRLILESAALDGGEITGHRILTATATVYNKLQSSNSQIWG